MARVLSLNTTLTVFYPLVFNYSSDAAILYGYLKSLIENYPSVACEVESNTFVLVRGRREMMEAINMSEGQMIDAELNLLGSGLVDASTIAGGQVEYRVRPHEEAGLASFVYLTRFGLKGYPPELSHFAPKS